MVMSQVQHVFTSLQPPQSTLCGNKWQFTLHSTAKWAHTKDVGSPKYYTHTHTHTHTVPMDLDVKMKAVMLGACILIVSLQIESPNVRLPQPAIV